MMPRTGRLHAAALSLRGDDLPSGSSGSASIALPCTGGRRSADSTEDWLTLPRRSRV